MKNTLLILITISFACLSCGKTEITQGIGTHATLYNQSGVSVRYIPYNSGVPDDRYTVDIMHNDSLFMGNNHDKGNGKNPGFSSPYLSGGDSIQILYDNKYIVTHIANIPDSLLKNHHLPFLNERHIGNPKNYIWWFVEETRQLYHEYYFTEEDYEYAQEHGMKIE